ncbi:hypothetical protein OAK24_00975, partial [Flavobacteriales bacterium]|nr:hypothetical protein [Flavobacteriales bacterium]
TNATGDYSAAMGVFTNATGDNSTAMGYGTNAFGLFSTAMGRNTNASGIYSTAMGSFNIGGGDATNWVATDPLFEIGNGIDDNNRNNALTVLKNGAVGIGTATPIRGKLEVMGNQQCCGNTNGTFSYYIYGNGVHANNGGWNHYGPSTGNFDISVYADGRFMGSGIHIFSDERIKDIVGLSNNKKDLSTLLSIERRN